MVPPQSILGVIPVWVGVYLALVAFLVATTVVLYQRVARLVLLGKPEPRFDRRLRRVGQALATVIGQRKVLQRFSPRDMAGLGHALVFWGFLSFLLSYVIFIFADSAWRPFSESLLTGLGVRVFASYLDVLAVAILLALAWAVVRRWAARPRRLSFDLTRSPDSVIIVAAIAGLMILTLLTEAFYVASGGEGPAARSLIGSPIGRWLEVAGLSAGVANGLQGLAWWLHLLLILGFGLYIPFSKHMHMLAAPPNAFFHKLVPRGTLSAIEDLESAERFGAGRLRDLTWKELLDGYACAVCGRCTDACPANLSGKVLSPMHVVEGVKEHLLREGARVAKGEEESQPLIGGAVSEEALWDCVTCGACIEECPVAIEHVDSIVDMRRYLLMEQNSIPDTGMQALMNMEQRGHPWRGTQFTRSDWYRDMDVPVLGELDDPSQVEVLLWVGCTPALEERSQGMARAAAAVLKRAGVNFAILGPEETCTGDPARRMGNEYTYSVMAQQNIETLDRYGVTTILTLCPHCFNTIGNEYPRLGGNYRVVHYTQFIGELVRQGRIRPVKNVATRLAYHDSCYLGRHNGIYDEPRELASAIPGLELVEFDPYRRQRGFCCGAGGGHLWMEESRGHRINHMRTDQFLETGAETVGVSCPYCLQMMEEGLASRGKRDERQARDLLEVLAESLEEDERRQ